MALLGLAASGFAGVASGAAAVTPKPAILGFTATPKRLTSDGGAVRLTVRVRNATTCTFRGQGAPRSAYNRSATVKCSSGRGAATLTVAPNTHASPATIHYLVRATAKGRTVQRTLTIVEEGQSDSGTVKPPPPPPTPPVIATTSLPGATVGGAYTTTLSASGGTEPYTWTVTQGTLPAGLTLAASGAIAGTPSASGSSTFTVTVTDAAQLTATAALSIAVLQPVLPVADLSRSTNWSGYTLDPGPFTYATGTLTVPSLTNLSQSVSVSEWVGIDGDTNSDLIQAGVAENYSSFTGTTEMHAWWEILPASETPIDPSVMNVQPGDTVTVTIQQLSPGSWSIALVDNTTGQSFSTTQAYSGPGTSAEWIVEAPSTDTGRLTTLADYTPNVVFTRIGWAGSATQFTPIEMVDRFSGSTISIPSALSADQTSFAVAYGATAPPAPS